MSTHNTDITTAFGTSSGTFASQTVLKMDFSLLKAELQSMGTDLDNLMSRVRFFDTRTEASAATIDTTVDGLIISGYTTLGDMAPQFFKKVASTPSHSGYFTSNSGTLTWEYVPGPEGVNVRALGAADNADSTTAFGNALDMAIVIQSGFSYASTNASGTYTGTWDIGIPTIFIPAGTYQLDATSDHIMDLTGKSAMRGLRIVGAGLDQTFLRLIGGSAKYFLNNPNIAKNVHLEGFSIHDETGNDNNILCYVSSTGTAKNTHIEDVFVELMGVCKIEGSANGDHARFVRVVCEDVPNGLDAYHISNSQSVDHQWNGCEWIGLAGRGIYCDGGGAFSAYGGSFVVYKGGRAIDIDASGSDIGSGNGVFDFYSIKTELRDDGTGNDPQILHLDAPATVNFYGSTYSVDEVSGTRTIDPYVIDRGIFQVHNAAYWQSNQLVTINAADADQTSRHPPIFAIYNSSLGAELADIVTINDPPTSSIGRSYGQAIAEGCWMDGGQDPVDVHINHWRGGHDRPVKKKRHVWRAGQSTGGGLPANGSPFTFTLPVGAVVVNVGITKEASSGSAGAVYVIKDGDAPTTLHTTGTINNGDHTTDQAGTLDPEWLVTAANQDFTVENSTGSAVAANGYVFAEWY